MVRNIINSLGRLLAKLAALNGRPRRVEHKLEVTLRIEPLDPRKGISGENLRLIEEFMYDEIEKILNNG